MLSHCIRTLHLLGANAVPVSQSIGAETTKAKSRRASRNRTTDAADPETSKAGDPEAAELEEFEKGRQVRRNSSRLAFWVMRAEAPHPSGDAEHLRADREVADRVHRSWRDLLRSAHLIERRRVEHPDRPHFGGYTDTVIMHTVDLQLSFPAIPVALDPVVNFAMVWRRSASTRPLPGRPWVCRSREASATCRAMTTGSASIPGSRS